MALRSSPRPSMRSSRRAEPPKKPSTPTLTDQRTLARDRPLSNCAHVGIQTQYEKGSLHRISRKKSFVVFYLLFDARMFGPVVLGCTSCGKIGLGCKVRALPFRDFIFGGGLVAGGGLLWGGGPSHAGSPSGERWPLWSTLHMTDAVSSCARFIPSGGDISRGHPVSFRGWVAGY